LYEFIAQDLEAKIQSMRYSRVILPLSALLEGEIFNEYIKKGTAISLWQFMVRILPVLLFGIIVKSNLYDTLIWFGIITGWSLILDMQVNYSSNLKPLLI